MTRSIQVSDLENIFHRSAQNEALTVAIQGARMGKLAFIDGNCRLIEALDAADERNWPLIITAALEAGVSKAEMTLELGNSASTLHRWLNDSIVPREGVRNLMKRALLLALKDKMDELKNADLPPLKAPVVNPP